MRADKPSSSSYKYVHVLLSIAYADFILIIVIDCHAPYGARNDICELLLKRLLVNKFFISRVCLGIQGF